MRKDKDWLSEQVGDLNSTNAIFDESGVSYIDTAVSIERVFDLIDQLDEPEKVVVPKFVGEWIEEAKKEGEKIHHQFGFVIEYAPFSKRKDYLFEHSETFARAWLDGYEVDKGPKYYVYLGDGQYLVSEDDLKEPHAKIRHQEDRGFLNYNMTFTEQEIKDYDERFWTFAIPVEEVEE